MDWDEAIRFVVKQRPIKKADPASAWRDVFDGAS
jgi:hypothetical protein